MSAPPPELEDEQEVDLSTGWQRLKVRWWLPLGGLVVGAVVGIALALSAGSVWRAPDARLPRSAVRPARGRADPEPRDEPRVPWRDRPLRVGLKAAVSGQRDPGLELRSSISTRELVAAGQLRGINPLIEITVKGSGKRKVELADRGARGSGRRARLALRHGEGHLLENQVDVSSTQLAAVKARIAEAQAQQDALAENQSLAPVEKLLLSQNLNAVITTADARRSTLQDDLGDARQLLNLAENVEKSRVVEPAAASKTTARSSRSSLLVGALIGLLLGAIAALVADPIAARRRGSTHSSD